MPANERPDLRTANERLATVAEAEAAFAEKRRLKLIQEVRVLRGHGEMPGLLSVSASPRQRFSQSICLKTQPPPPNLR